MEQSLLQERSGGGEPNAHLPPFMTGEKPLPGEGPGYYQFGDITEAEAIIDDLLIAWTASEGAIDWLTRRWHYFRRK